MSKQNGLRSPTGCVQAVSENQTVHNPNLEVVGRLASGVAHDFNNLLTGVLLYCDLMADELNHSGRRVPDRNKLRHAAEEIRNACERGTALIQQLMAVARPATAEAASVCWNDACLGMMDLLRRLLGENVELVTDFATGLKTIDLSPARAEQVLLNLALNARDAMPKGGKIVLQTRNSGPSERSSQAYVELAVTDTGCGMDQPTLAHAFEAFFTTKPNGRGTGLGLANVQSIIGQAGGEVLIESEVGSGTRVQVRLPAGRICKQNPEKLNRTTSRVSISRRDHNAPKHARMASISSANSLSTPSVSLSASASTRRTH